METSDLNGRPVESKALVQLKSVLVEGESLDAWSFQIRLFALTHRRMLAAATSGRFIVIRRGLIGGFDMTDFRWQDLEDIRLRVGIFGADLFVKKFGTSDMASNESSVLSMKLKGFQKEQTEKIYRLAQAQEQSWREKRRVRDLEELRAKSGGINVGNLSGARSSEASSDDSVERLKKAKEMLDNKLISDSEYESLKAKIISGL